ncbi:MAG: methionine--tRNA ligase [Candidatus Nanohaloarchaea archaeon]
MSSDQRKVTITSALPYVHGVPHLGNITAFLPADIFHRYLDLKGVENKFIWGSDVHGTPLELEAIERDMPVEELKDKQHEKVKKVLTDFKFDYSIYSDTHSDYNRKQTHDMFEELYCSGYINEKEQILPYCNNDERFLPDRYVEGECPHCGGLARGDQCDDCGKLVEPDEIDNKECQICGKTDVEMRETTHLFLDLPQFKDELLEWLENSEETPIPEHKVKEYRNAIKDTEQRCITRDIEWGFDIPVERINQRIEEESLDVPKLDEGVYSDKVVYVWFDAPIGYIGFTREYFDDSEEWKENWNQNAEIYYSLGKDNGIFHTVMWPSMLIGASNEEIEYGLPNYEFIHEWLLAEDTKFSKSRGKGLSTEEALEMHPADYWRFYLAKNIPNDHDTTFTWQEFEKEVNNVLNDTVGNFVNRTLSLAEKWFNNQAPVAEPKRKDEETIKKAEQIVENYREAFDNHEIKKGVDKAVELARLGDQYLSEEEPWNNQERREETINTAIQIIRALAVTLYPYTPDTSEKIAEMLNTEIHTEQGFNELIDPLLGGIEDGHPLGEREILFEKIDTTEQQEGNDQAKQKFNQDTVSFEEFQNMDIRTGKIQKVEEHPNADKLYKIQVDIGEATLQTCAGLKNHYKKDELEGKNVVVLANLEPTELRGETSECMMLAAENQEGDTVSLLDTDQEIEIGSEIK